MKRIYCETHCKSIPDQAKEKLQFISNQSQIQIVDWWPHYQLGSLLSAKA